MEGERSVNASRPTRSCKRWQMIPCISAARLMSSVTLKVFVLVGVNARFESTTGTWRRRNRATRNSSRTWNWLTPVSQVYISSLFTVHYYSISALVMTQKNCLTTGEQVLSNENIDILVIQIISPFAAIVPFYVTFSRTTYKFWHRKAAGIDVLVGTSVKCQ